MAIPSLAAGPPSRAGRIIKRARRELLELSFFVDHVLPSNWIILLELKFVGGIRPVFRGCVEVTGPRRGFKLDLFPLALLCPVDQGAMARVTVHAFTTAARTRLRDNLISVRQWNANIKL